MNKYFERYIPSLPYQFLNFMSGILYLLGILVTVFVYISNKSIIVSIFLSALFIGLIYFFSKATQMFRNNQISWLKVNGKRILCQFNKLKPIYYDTASPDTRRVYVNGIHLGLSKIFKSDLIVSGWILPNEAKSTIISKIKNHGENIDVWINPQNPKVYWVDTDFLN